MEKTEIIAPEETAPLTKKELKRKKKLQKENIAFVGETLDGKNIIVILPNALCTSGLSIEGKSGEECVGKFTFECHGDASESLTTLPYKIYYPAEG